MTFGKGQTQGSMWVMEAEQEENPPNDVFGISHGTGS